MSKALASQLEVFKLAICSHVYNSGCKELEVEEVQRT